MEKIYPMHIRPICAETELHLTAPSRSYFNGLPQQNNVLIKEEIALAKRRLCLLAKKKTGRSMQKHAAPLREALLVYSSDLQMKQIAALCRHLKRRFGVGTVQIHLHPVDNITQKGRHAHVIFNWMDEKTGKSIKLDKRDMAELQMIVRKDLEKLQQINSCHRNKNKASFWKLVKTLFILPPYFSI